jgi:hypothetical protein
VSDTQRVLRWEGVAAPAAELEGAVGRWERGGETRMEGSVAVCRIAQRVCVCVQEGGFASH